MSMHDDIKTVLVSEEQLKAKVAELGAQISKDYEGRQVRYPCKAGIPPECAGADTRSIRQWGDAVY